MTKKEYIVQISTSSSRGYTKVYGLSNLGRLFEYDFSSGGWQLRSGGLD